MAARPTKPLMVWEIYEETIRLFGLNKTIADECGEIVIRLSVGDIVRVEYKTRGTKIEVPND